MRIITARDLAAVVRGRRQDLRLTQAAVAEAANVSRKWLGEFERGKSTVDLAHVLNVLDALGLSIQAVTSGAPTEAQVGELSDPAAHVHLDDLLTGYLDQ